MRVVDAAAELDDAYARCRSEAQAAFGDGDLYVEQTARARATSKCRSSATARARSAISGSANARCSAATRSSSRSRRARRSTKPRARGCSTPAVRIAGAARYESLGTFEFLVDAPTTRAPRFVFIEANPRLQVEHTVTEEVTGVDLVAAQLRLAAGESLAELGLRRADAAEAARLRASGARQHGDDARRRRARSRRAARSTAFEPPAGPGVRVDTFGYAGYTTSPSYDSLLAKLIVHSPRPSFADARAHGRAARSASSRSTASRRTSRSCARCCAHPDVGRQPRSDTRFVEEHAARARRVARSDASVDPTAARSRRRAVRARRRAHRHAAIRSRCSTHGKAGRRPRAAARRAADDVAPDGTSRCARRMQGTIVSDRGRRRATRCARASSCS